ncbi:hypothetical protein M501DRAFT_995482, partial [Patellaria atrata CBS 101060]
MNPTLATLTTMSNIFTWFLPQCVLIRHKTNGHIHIGGTDDAEGDKDSVQLGCTNGETRVVAVKDGLKGCAAVLISVSLSEKIGLVAQYDRTVAKLKAKIEKL